jgi:phosphatidate phosphatase PAH1
MRDLHHARGSASGHYNDRGGKSGGDEERGRERDRYNERDRSRGWQCDTESARDRDWDRSSDSKLFNHVNELNKQILNKSDTRELFRGRDGPDRQKDRGKDSGEERRRDSRDRNDRNNERDSNKGFRRSRDSDRDRGRDRGSDRERQYTKTQRPSKQFNIELNKQVMRISDTRELCDFVSTHAAEFNHVNVATAFRQVLK